MMTALPRYQANTNVQVSPANQSTLTGTSLELRPLQTEHASELFVAAADGELWNMKANRKLEIGNTWLSSSVQRSGINTEAKLLLLIYAFEAMDAICVQFTTDELSEKSRATILRIGAKQEDSQKRTHHAGWPQE